MVQDRQFVTFSLHGRIMAIDMFRVREIVPLPNISRVPLASDAVMGFTNLRGSVLPVVALGQALGLEGKTVSEESQVIVLQDPIEVGIAVDKVLNVVAVPPRALHEMGSNASLSVAETFLAAVLTGVGNHSPIGVINVEALISRQLYRGRAVEGKAGPGITSSVEPHEEKSPAAKEADVVRVVVFEVGGQRYALDVGEVKEILQYPSEIVPLSTEASYVLGLSEIRGQMILLLSVRGLLDLESKPPSEENPVLILSKGSITVGLVVDEVLEIADIQVESLQELPPVFEDQQSSLVRTKYMLRIRGEDPLVSIIDTDGIVKMGETIAREFPKTGVSSDPGAGTTEDTAHRKTGNVEQTVVAFRLENLDFVVPIEAVEEIMDVPSEITPVPGAREAVQGLVSLRGRALPIISLRTMMGLPEIEGDVHGRIVILAEGQHRRGFVVDEVTEILNVPVANFHDGQTGQDVAYTDKVVTFTELEGLAFSLDVSKLLAERVSGEVEVAKEENSEHRATS